MKPLLKCIQPILEIGNKLTDTEDTKREQGFLIYMGILMSSGGILWGTVCLFNEMYIAILNQTSG